MAINLETVFPTKVDPASTEYPYGEPRNVTVSGDGTGTPWDAAWVKDFAGFQQSSLKAAGIVPDGSNDEVGASQYFQAHKMLASGLANWGVDTGAANVYVVNPAAADVPKASALFDGYVIRFKPLVTNTGASTINVDGLGVKAIEDDGSALMGGELVADLQITLIYHLADDHWDIVRNMVPFSRQVFTSSGSYTPAAGTRRILVEVQAAGGGGGGAPNPGGGNASSGRGGGGGEYRAGVLDVAALSIPETVTIGAAGSGGTSAGTDGTSGGASSLAAHITTVGGVGGDGGGAVVPPSRGEVGGGGGGTGGTGGDYDLRGERGGIAGIFSTSNGIGGDGGSSWFGFGARGALENDAATKSGQGKGSGGSGGLAVGAGSGNAGGAGTTGIIIIWEFN